MANFKYVCMLNIYMFAKNILIIKNSKYFTLEAFVYILNCMQINNNHKHLKILFHCITNQPYISHQCLPLLNIYMQCIFPLLFVFEICDVRFPIKTISLFTADWHKYKCYHVYYI